MSGSHMMLMGAGGGAVSLTDQAIEGTALSPASATASYTLTSDGVAQEFATGIGTTTIAREWWSAAPQAGIGAGFEVRWTPAGDPPTSGTVNTWLPLSSTRTWSYTRSTIGTQAATGTVEIRPTGGAVVDSATITLQATIDV